MVVGPITKLVESKTSFKLVVTCLKQIQQLVALTERDPTPKGFSRQDHLHEHLQRHRVGQNEQTCINNVQQVADFSEAFMPHCARTRGTPGTTTRVMTLEESGMFLSVAQIFDDQPELSYAATERDLNVSEMRRWRDPFERVRSRTS